MKICYSIQAFVLIASYFSCHAHESDDSKPFEKMHAHQTFEAHVHAGWESKYSSEGRDALDGKSLWISSLEMGYDHFSGGVWYGRSSNHSYDEWQYSFALTQEVEALEFYAGYTHLVFAMDNESDDEWSAGISYGELPWGVGTALDGVYSLDAEGFFFEWSSGKTYSLGEDLEVSFSGILGWNEGYIPDGHDGVNFFSLRTGGEHVFTENFSLTGHGAYSWGIDRDLSMAGDLQLKDFFHLGLGIEWSF